MNQRLYIAEPPAWRRTRLERLATANLLLGVIFTAIYVFFAIRARFTVPYMDDWAWLASLHDHPWTKGLWQPHNEHVIVIPRMLVWFDFWMWGWPGYATLVAGLSCHAAMAAVLIRACVERNRAEARLLSGTILALIFLTYELQGTVFPSSVNFPLVAAFSALAIAALARCAGTVNRQSTRRWTTVSMVMTVMAMLCLTNGLLLPLVLAGLSALIRLPRRTTAAFLSVGVVGLVGRYAIGGMPATVLAGSAVAVVRFGLTMLAGPIATLSPGLAETVGVCYCALAFWALWRFVWTVEHTSATTLAVGITWFVLASAAMAASSRAHFDPSVGAESRYSELAALGWASILVFALPINFTARPIGTVAAFALPIVALAALPMQVFVGRVWAAKADHLDVASLVLTVGVNNGDWIWRIHSLGPASIEPVLPQLRARHVSFLAFPERDQQTQYQSTAAVSCQGSLAAITPRQPNAGLEVLGHLRERGELLRVVDGESRVRGLAKPAPLVHYGRATANDLVLAEIDRLTGKLNSEGDWLGFTTWGSGPPFRAELLDSMGQLVCQVAIGCCEAAPALAPRPEIVIRGGQLEGWLDTIDCSNITGWAWDFGRPDNPVEVTIKVLDGGERKFSASLFRRDLLEAGKGNGNHGFILAAQDLKLAGGTRNVSASFSTGVPLSGSPRTVMCPN